MNKLLLAIFIAFTCFLLQACSSTPPVSSVTPPAPAVGPTESTAPPAPPAGALAILSPAAGSTHGTATPVTIKVRFASGAQARAMRVLLDGVDITSRFTPADGAGVRQATVERPAMNLGKNQILVKSGPRRATSGFFLAAGPLGGAPTLGQALPLLVPIKTRVVTGDGSKATDYNIALYKDPDNPTAATLIQAPALKDGSNTGFQIVYLKRTDLSVVSNVSIDRSRTPSEDGDFYGTPLYYALAGTPSDCGAAGCIQVVQSLGKIGFSPCYSADFPKYCEGYSSELNALGLSERLAYANGDSQQIAASHISNAKISGEYYSAGTFFESLTCSGSNYGGGPPCDSLGYPNTSFTAPKNATASQLGAISGALIRDNYNNFTFVQTRRPVGFSIVTATNGSSGLTNTITVDGVPYTSGSLQGQDGGFHLVILRSTDLHLIQNQTFPSRGNAREAQQLYDAITGYQSYPFLFFIVAYGDTHYNCQAGTGHTCAARELWYKTSKLMERLGGTQQVFYLVNNPEVENPPRYDDYTLVGSFVDGPGMGLTQYAAEMSSVIDRKTLANPPPAGAGHGEDMDGFLAVNHQGFYAPTNFGHHLNLSKVTVAEILSASTLSPTLWPFPGPDPAKAKAAYDWISLQLCCTDIRDAYVNLNISPGIWLAQLRQLTYDSSKIPGSSQAAFDAMKDQLATEFQYVTLVRLFQSNLVGLFQDQQANIALLLQNDVDKVMDNLQVGLNTPVHSASWTSVLDEVFSINSSLLNAIPEGELVTTGTEIALTVGTAVASEAASRTNSPAGTPLQGEENEEVAAGNLADNLATKFSANLVSLGNDFDRIVTDWGRLKTLGGPLLADQIPWDGSSSGLLLQGFDRSIQRELYAKLYQPNYSVVHFPYTGDSMKPRKTSFHHNDLVCYWVGTSASGKGNYVHKSAVLYYPSGRVNDDRGDPNNGANKYPYHYQWGIWALTLKTRDTDGCPGDSNAFPDMFGLFKPLDPGKPDNLGAYQYWFFTRSGFHSTIQNDNKPCYSNDAC